MSDPTLNNPNFSTGAVDNSDATSDAMPSVTVTTAVTQPNEDQTMSAVRTLLTIGGVAAVARGYTDNNHAALYIDYAMEAIGALSILASFAWSQLKHAGVI